MSSVLKKADKLNLSLSHPATHEWIRLASVWKHIIVIKELISDWMPLLWYLAGHMQS